MKIIIAILIGTGSFRFYFQPLMAVFRGFKHGRQDSQQGNAPLLTRIINSSQKKKLIIECIRDISPVIFIALIIDIYAQWVIFNYIYVVLTLLVIMVVVVVPYFLARDLTNRRHQQFIN